MTERRITKIEQNEPALGEPRLHRQVYIIERSKRDVVALNKTGLIDKLGFRADQMAPGANLRYIQNEEFELNVPWNRKQPANPTALAKIIDDAVQEAYDMLILHVA